jgi:LDH2 family malate/lactate/ureidoglycolate dehydrogenase
LGISHTFIAIDPTRFLPAGEFERRIDRLAGLVKAAAPAAGYEEVLLAGEPEWRTEAVRERGGVPVPLKLWSRLSEIAGELKVTPPQSLAAH